MDHLLNIKDSTPKRVVSEMEGDEKRSLDASFNESLIKFTAGGAMVFSFEEVGEVSSEEPTSSTE